MSSRSSSSSISKIKIPNFITSIKLKQIESYKTVVDFQGDEITHTLFYLYLLKKYSPNNICYMLNPAELKHPYFVWGLKLILGESIEKTKNFEKNYKERCKILAARFVNCIKRTCEFILIPVRIFFKEPGKKETGHENVIIYKFALNKIEHIEPHGQVFNGPNALEYHKRIQFLIKIFIDDVNEAIEKEDMEQVEFVDTEATCPTGFIIPDKKNLLGFQALEGHSMLERFPDKEPGGYCLAWSMFMFEMGMLNPTLSSRQINDSITEYIITQSPAADHPTDSGKIVCDYLLRLIRGYANIVFEKIDKYFSGAFKIRINRTSVEDEEKNDEIREKIHEMMIMETRIEENKEYNTNDVSSQRIDAKEWIYKSNAKLKENPYDYNAEIRLKISTKKLNKLDNYLKLKSKINNSPNINKLHMNILPPFLISIGSNHGNRSRSSSSSSSSSSNIFSSSSSSSSSNLSPVVWNGYTESEKKKQAELKQLELEKVTQDAIKQLEKVTQEAMKQTSPPDVIDLSTSAWVVDLTSSPSTRRSNGSKKRRSSGSKKPSHKNIIDLKSSRSRSGGRSRKKRAYS